MGRPTNLVLLVAPRIINNPINNIQASRKKVKYFKIKLNILIPFYE